MFFLSLRCLSAFTGSRQVMLLAQGRQAAWEKQSDQSAKKSAWPYRQVALSTQQIHPILHFTWSFTAPTCCSFGRSYSISFHSFSLPKPLKIKASAHGTNPHVIIYLFPLIRKTSRTHSLKMVNALSSDGKRVASSFIWVTEPKPSSDYCCPAII